MDFDSDSGLPVDIRFRNRIHVDSRLPSAFFSLLPIGDTSYFLLDDAVPGYSVFDRLNPANDRHPEQPSVLLSLVATAGSETT